jgi:uncharacterized protein YjbI with pentapeptide repeats
MLTRRNGEPPPKGPAPASFASKATDLQALRDAVVDAAGVGTGLWLSYLFALFYFAIAAGAVTHRDLLLENPVKLPFLNVELPLKAFFVLGPLVFLIIHAYVLLHFVLLAGKIGAFHKQLQAEISGDDRRAELRRQLPSNIFVQSLAGPRDVRGGLLGFLLKSILWISLIAGPIALLILFQLQFLPYHSAWITNWQRMALVIDLALLWILWPPIARSEAKLLPLSDLRRPKIQAWACLSVLPVLLVVTIATFPGEWLEENLPSFRLVPTAWPKLPPESAYADNTRSQNQSPKAALTGQPPETPVAGPTPFDTSNGIITTILALMKLGSLDELLAVSFPDYVPFKKAVTAAFASTEPRSLHDLLVAGTINYVTDSPNSLWSNVLVLPDFKAGDRLNLDGDKIAIRSDALSLRGRDLQGAVFVRAHLENANFTGGILRDVTFWGADLSGAQFECDIIEMEPARCTSLKRTVFDFASLQGASFDGAKLQDATFRGALIDGASFDYAQLHGANFDPLPDPPYPTRLRAASFVGAKLQGASFRAAQVQGANFKGAALQGSSFAAASLRDADLSGAGLQGADLAGAELRGANLKDAQLQGAFLAAASLRDADLSGTGLQGADLTGARLQGAALRRVFVWRTNAPDQQQANGALIDAPESGARYLGLGCDLEFPEACDWTEKTYKMLKAMIELDVPAGSPRGAALMRIAVLEKSPYIPAQPSAKAWANLASSKKLLGSPKPLPYPQRLAQSLEEIGCAAEPPYVVAAIGDQLGDRFDENSPEAAALAKAFLTRQTCTGAQRLSKRDREGLREIWDRAGPPTAVVTPAAGMADR